MSETADLLHHVPGRARLRIPAGKGNRARLEHVQQVLEQMPGVHRVDTNVVLGSVLVQYDPAVSANFIRLLTDYAAQHELFALTCDDTEACISEADRSVHRFMNELNKGVQAATGDLINLKELLPLAMGVYGLLFVNRSQAAAQWLNWIQVAFDTYIDLHEDEPVTEVAQRLDLLGAQIMAQQTEILRTLRSEMSDLRSEVRALSSQLPRA